MIGYDILNLIFFERRRGRGGVRDNCISGWSCEVVNNCCQRQPRPQSLLWFDASRPKLKKNLGTIICYEFLHLISKATGLQVQSSPARGLQVQSSSCFTICPKNESCFNDNYLFSVKVFGRLLEFLRNHLL